MPSPGPRVGHRLSSPPPTFTARVARAAAISPRDLSALIAEGEVEELSRGLHRRGDAPPTTHPDLVAGCIRAPHAVARGESALSLDELIDDIPHEGRREGREPVDCVVGARSQRVPRSAALTPSGGNDVLHPRNQLGRHIQRIAAYKAENPT
jgi:hypothetical protein